MKTFFSNINILLILMLAIVLAYSCNGSKGKSTEANHQSNSIMVYAASSLTDVISELIQVYESSHKVKVKTNMASSGTLARQIEQGGNADIFISANKSWADYVNRLGVVISGVNVEIARNELVLIAPLDSSLDSVLINSNTDWNALIGDGRLSMGDPIHVPAGMYAKQSLEYYETYDQLKRKILPSKDVRSALMMVEMGESPLGIVYRTDAMKSTKVKVVSVFPEDSHQPIVYLAGVCSNNVSVKEFYSFLNSEEAKAIWYKYGFDK